MIRNFSRLFAHCFPCCFDARAAVLPSFHRRLVAAFQVTVLGVFGLFWVILVVSGGAFVKIFWGNFLGIFGMVLRWF